MGKQLKQFPLVGDDEPVITLPRYMALYGNEDLIVNIHGDYQDKFFEEESSVLSKSVAKRVPSLNPRPDLERVKRAARADVKKKRQALVVTDKKLMTKSGLVAKADVAHQESVSSSAISQGLEKSAVISKQARTWSDYAKALEQTDYILVELPKSYEQPKNPSAKRPHKQNFDFLKQSQIYNYDANQRKRERQIAQELNLSTFDDRKLEE